MAAAASAEVVAGADDVPATAIAASAGSSVGSTAVPPVAGTGAPPRCAATIGGPAVLGSTEEVDEVGSGACRHGSTDKAVGGAVVGTASPAAGAETNAVSEAAAPATDGADAGAAGDQLSPDQVRIEAAAPAVGKAASAAPGTAPDTSPRLPTLKLLRGFSGCGQEEGILVELVVNAVDSWAQVDRKAITVEENSGEGAMVTHKITAPPGSCPAAVALHSWTDDDELDQIYKQRTSVSGQLFAKHSLAPPRLAEGSSWFLEPWEGSGNPELDATRMQELGQLVARVHRLPSSWYEPFREQLCHRLPVLRQVPHGSHVWWWTAKEDLLGDCSERVLEMFLGATWFAPETAAGRRIVTAHADMHHGNMLQTESGIRVIDFEYTCVTHAVLDLAFAAATCCSDDPLQKRDFIEAYLVASGQPATPEDVAALQLDAELAFLGCHTAPLELWIAHDEEEKWVREFTLFKPLVEEVRRFPELRAQVLERGIVPYLRAYKDFCLPSCPVILSSQPHSDHNRVVLGADGTIAPLALRTSLAFGIAADGSLALVSRGDTRMLRFGARVAGHSQLLTLPSLRELKAGTEFQLVLCRNHQFGLGVRPGSRRLIKGTALVEVLHLVTSQLALPLSLDGDFVVHRGPGDARLSLYLGNAEYDIARQQAQELYTAAGDDNLTELQRLLALGADLNFPQEHESLGHAAARGGHLAVLSFLLDAGLDANATSASYGGSALVEAATYGHVSCVERLLRVPGIDLSLEDNEMTALDWARDPSRHCQATPEHAKIVALLEAHGGKK